MNPNFSTQPRLRHAVVFQEHPDPLPHLPHQADNLCTVILLSSGAAVFAAGRRQYAVQPGDALVCRPGVRNGKHFPAENTRCPQSSGR